MNCQIDWLPLGESGVRPTQGRTLVVMQVSGGSKSFTAVDAMRLLGRWMRMVTIPNQSSVPNCKDAQTLIVAVVDIDRGARDDLGRPAGGVTGFGRLAEVSVTRMVRLPCAIAMFMISIPVSSLIGSTTSALLLQTDG